jgi:leucyl aminopeptidase
MKINALCQNTTDFSGDAMIVDTFQDERVSGSAASVDRALDGIISKLVADGEISGKLGETAVIHHCDNLKVRKVIVVGLGKRDDFDYEAVRRAAGAAAKKAKEIKAKRVGTVIHGAGIRHLDMMIVAQSLVEGTILSQYTFAEYKKPDDIHSISTFSIIDIDKAKVLKIKKAAELGRILAESQNIARDLINAPANNLTPELLFRRIRSTIRKSGLSRIIKCHCLNKKTLQHMGMGALLSVGQGSSSDPKFIVLRVRTANRPLICLIGKTVTFDSGGISIKPSAGMGTMKGDMAGGAVAIGATLSLARARNKVNLMTIIPAVENMPSGSAYRPGDVVRAMNGKTIEIVSTDAEGRLTIADALTYGENKGARTIIDIATLTGGCAVALGNSVAAVMGNAQELIDKIIEISRVTGEAFWQLPLYDEYKKQIRSDVADLKNSGGRNASTITAGLFLQEFIDKAHWLHIDVAGKELTEKGSYYTPIGGTGFGVRTLHELIKRL